jgi:regulator of RNase E activity RraB
MAVVNLKRWRPEEGEFIAVELPSGGYGIALIARVNKRRSIMLLYIFSPRRSSLPDMADLTQLNAADATMIKMVDLHQAAKRMENLSRLHSLGKHPNWNRADWEFRPAVEYTVFETVPYLVYYDEATFKPVKYVEYPPEQLLGKIYTDEYYMLDSLVRTLDREIDSPPSPDAWWERMLQRREEHARRLPELLEIARSGDTQMRQEDRTAFAFAVEQGLDTSRPQQFEHYLYFPKRVQAKAAASELVQRGFEVSIERGASEDNWLLLAKQTIIPDEDTLDATIEFLEEFAPRYGGNYDGWGVELKRSPTE